MGKITDMAKKMKHPKAKAYWTKAEAHCADLDKWFAVERDSKEYEAWSRYFDRLGWEPRHWRDLRKNEDDETGRIDMFLVPAQWPEWFDTTFAGRHAEAAE